ncbi:MAG: tRNA sulfurtransferase [Thermoplasmata archaeon]
MNRAKGILLLSGGIDSPVAGHLMAQKGIEVIALHFSLEPFTDRAPEEKALRIVDILGFPRLYICRIGDALAEIARNCRHRFYFVLSKRLMYRLAETLALQEGAASLITGESLGQVSSQTLSNLRAIDASVEVSVVRPLIGWDKVDIMETARRIGTYDISKGPEVCDVLGPSHPTTQARLEVVEAEESKLRYGDLLSSSLETLRMVEPHESEAATSGEA